MFGAQLEKKQLLRQAIWPRAFYGISTCALGEAHLKRRRSEAMKALGFKQAGAAPGLRLSLLCHEQCDPGLSSMAGLCAISPNCIQTSYVPPCVAPLHGWTIDVPSLLDQDGLRLNWLDME